MNETDVQREWRALVEAYAGMGDEELSSLAEQAYELTDLARQALQAEIKARGLSVTPVETPPPPAEPEEKEVRGDFDPEEFDLVPLSHVWDASEARDIMKKLHDAAVPAYVGLENAETVDVFRGNFETGVDIRVRAVDRNRAIGALVAAAPHKSDDIDATKEETPQPRCPSCHSEEIVFVELVPAPGTTALAPS